MGKIGRRDATVALGVSVLPLGVRADDFPARPITLVVPYAAGGPVDVLARLTADHAGRTLGQSVVVDNRGGAAGLIGAASVASAEPDGYVLLMASAGQVTIPPWVNRALTFDPPRDLVPVAHLADTPMALIVSAQSDMKTVDDFVTRARAQRGALNYASTTTCGPDRCRACSSALHRSCPLSPAAGCGRSPSPRRHARRSCPECRPWQKPAGRGSRSWCGPASWRRLACRA
jgi:tripartite-type tricarboxylate transporter receptor subunit TctC